MGTSDLRRLLEDELDALREPMRSLGEEARDFWRHPETPALSVWANFPALEETPEPPAGSLTEQALYAQLHDLVRPARRISIRATTCVSLRSSTSASLHQGRNSG